MEAVRRQLIVVRHAKSDWPPGVADRSRPLGPRGIVDAPRMGARIRAAVGAVDVAVVSPAERARQTWQLLGAQLGGAPRVLTDDRVYDEWGARMIDVVRELPAEATTAMIVGHEPGVSELVLRLADGSRRDLEVRIDAKFPTCAVAVLHSNRQWGEVAPGCAWIESFMTPKD